MWPGGKALASPAPPASEQVLQEGFGRRIVREADDLSVRKTFTAGPWAERQRMAAEELARLTRFSAALAGVPGASCPRPLGLVQGPEPGYRMSWVEGHDLAEYLDRRAVPEEELTGTGLIIARALQAYICAVGEPYYDLKVGNVLVCPGGDLAFVDFGPPQDEAVPSGADAAYETSVGNFLANLVFESARPRRVFHRRLHRQGAVVAIALVDALREAGQPLREDVLLPAARGAYRRCTFDRGSLSRTAWYATAGRLTACPVRTPVGVVGPASLRNR